MNNIITLEGVVSRTFGPKERGKDNKWMQTDFIIGLTRKDKNGETIFDSNGKKVWDNILCSIRESINLSEQQKVRVSGYIRRDSWQDKKTNEWREKTYVSANKVESIENWSKDSVEAVMHATGSI